MKSEHRTPAPHFSCLLLAISLLTEGGRLAAQPAAPMQTPPESQNVLLKQGTEVKLKLRDPLSSKTAVEGDPVNLALDEDLRVGDVVVARSGSVAIGTISHAERSGILGRGGDLAMTLEYLQAGNSRVKLRGSKGMQGKGKEGTAVVLTVLLGPIGLVKHGKNAEFKQGTALTAYVEQDTELSSID